MGNPEWINETIESGTMVGYSTASELGGEGNNLIARVRTTDNPDYESWVPDEQQLEPGTSVTLIRNFTSHGKGGHHTTTIISNKKAQ